MTAAAQGRGVVVAGWAFGLALVGVGLANLVLVHPVPAAGYGVLALAYLPPVRQAIRRRWGWGVHPSVLVGLAVVAIVFTLGVSDLGDMLD